MHHEHPAIEVQVLTRKRVAERFLQRAQRHSLPVFDVAGRRVPGNVMPFSGLAADKQRADLIAYLKTLK